MLLSSLSSLFDCNFMDFINKYQKLLLRKLFFSSY
uniref:Uncharacterized protein n=1 Tax=Siphoviridae sp. ctqPo10 TaxID=2827948 RepID=A0A8S5SVG7_9CAUD|nr:MAG TPA: hypothetical protein [Siphoviridae sp. ctqPo10]